MLPTTSRVFPEESDGHRNRDLSWEAATSLWVDQPFCASRLLRVGFSLPVGERMQPVCDQPLWHGSAVDARRREGR